MLLLRKLTKTGAFLCLLPKLYRLKRLAAPPPGAQLCEHAATAHLVAELEALGARILGTGLETGLVAELCGGRPGPTLALRADLDALPIAEDPPHLRSEALGAACTPAGTIPRRRPAGRGGAAAQRKAGLAGRVLLVFQPGAKSGRGAL